MSCVLYVAYNRREHFPNSMNRFLIKTVEVVVGVGVGGTYCIL
jgi:hypothetical protein